MATEDSKIYVRRRKRGSTEQDEGTPHVQSRWAEGHSLEREKKEDLISQDEDRLINLELDVAEALAKLWRMAREPSQQGIFDVHLRWSCKRIRTSSVFKKDPITPCKPKEELEDAVSSAKNRSSCISERDSMSSDREEIESTRISKETSECDLRAESPNCPLPSLQLAHGAFLPRSNPTAKSAFQRVLPMASLQRPYLLPVKSEIEDVHLDGFDARPQKSSVCRNSRSPTIARGWKGPASHEVLRKNSELCLVSDLAVLNKPKPAFSEKEKETRKLLRIQANRESARLTIRRKQIVCDELMKKASSLTLENEGMKQKRESLMQKLFCLRGENYHLKQQMKEFYKMQVPSLQYAGFPLHAVTWTMAATQAIAPNQAHTFYNNKEKPSDAVHNDFFVSQHHATAMSLPAMPPRMEAPVLRIVEQSPSHVLNGVCSPALMRRLPHKETGCTKLESSESCIPQSEGMPCDPSSTTTVADLGLTDDVTEESACMPANCSSSQLSSPTTCSSSQACLNTTPEIAASFDSTEGYNKHSQITQKARFGYTYDDSRGGHFFSVHSLSNGFRGRNHFAVVAAAEARKRRKELTRQKFLRSRVHRAGSSSC